MGESERGAHNKLSLLLPKTHKYMAWHYKKIKGETGSQLTGLPSGQLFKFLVSIFSARSCE